LLRLEFDYSYERIAEALGKPSPDAARMAVGRAIAALPRSWTTMDDERLIDDALAIADRRPAATASKSESIAGFSIVCALCSARRRPTKREPAEDVFPVGALEVRRLLARVVRRSVRRHGTRRCTARSRSNCAAPRTGHCVLDERRKPARVRHPHVLTYTAPTCSRARRYLDRALSVARWKKS
jgi:hypothetical protein